MSLYRRHQYGFPMRFSLSQIYDFLHSGLYPLDLTKETNVLPEEEKISLLSKELSCTIVVSVE